MGLALALAAAAALPGCTASPSVPRTPSVARPVAGFRTFAFALGIDGLGPQTRRRLGAYDLAVVDGDTPTHRQVEALRAHGTTVLAYLSVGTVEPYRAWYARARRNHWLLERWPDWNEWYADVAAPGFRALITNEARRYLAKGFDGLFLDNTDMVDTHPAQVSGMRQLVTTLDALVGPRGLLMAQNGDDSVAAIAPHLDGWNREDLTSTFDRDRGGYVPVAASDTAAAVATIRRLRRAGLFVTTTDYVASTDRAAVARSVRVSCAAGAIPYAADLGLRRIPSPPLRCP